MKNVKENITTSITLLAVVPLLILGLVLMIITSNVIFNSLKDEVKYSLSILVHSTHDVYELKYPGKYEMYGDDVLKGGKSLKNELSFVDEIKEMSGADATLFFENKRYLTTILNPDGSRAVGTVAVEDVTETVLKNGEEYFSSDVLVNGTKYFGYYMPIKNSSDKVIGMLFAGKPRSEVMNKINRNINNILITIATFLVCTVFITTIYSNKIIVSLKEIKSFLEKIARGDLNAKIEPKLLDRLDEIGEMGRFSVMLKDSITDLVGKDPLTGLYNRRTGRITFDNLVTQYNEKGISFTVAMADIDYFKTINDTYSHQIGDEVLNKVSKRLLDHMKGLGFVFRWGGEEFLLIYENMSKEEVHSNLEKCRKDMESLKISLDDLSIPITLTFGIASYTEVEDIPSLLSLADSRLYKGKASGRNKIIS